MESSELAPRIIIPGDQAVWDESISQKGGAFGTSVLAGKRGWSKEKGIWVKGHHNKA